MMMMVVEGLKKEVVRRVVEEDEQKRENGRRGESAWEYVGWRERKNKKYEERKKEIKKNFKK